MTEKPKDFEDWYTDVFGGHITEEQASDELRIAYDYYVDNRKLTIENAELKNRNHELLESCEGATMMYKQLTKAKEIIKKLLDFDFLPDIEIKKQAEQFLGE